MRTLLTSLACLAIAALAAGETLPAKPAPTERDSQAELRGAASWQVVATNALAVAAVERALYERADDPHFYIRVRITNQTDLPIGVDLSDYWRVIYPNQWGISQEPRRGTIDERRRQGALLPIALFLDFADGKLTRLAPGESADYYREFNASGRQDIEAQAPKAAGTHLIVSLDGAVPVTEGKGVKPLSCVWDGGRNAANTDLVIPLPVKWAAIPTNARIVAETAAAAAPAAQCLAPFYRNGWHGWPVGTETRTTFLDDKVEGWYSYVQPDLVYRLTETALLRTQVVDGKPVVQQFDPANETGWQPAYLHKLPTAKTTPTTIEIDGVKIDCLLHESSMDLIGRDMGGRTVLKEWVLADQPTIWLRTGVNQNYKVIKSLRAMKQVGDRQVACVVVEERMEMSGGHSIATSWLSAEVPGHVVEKISEIWLEGRQQRSHEKLAEVREPLTLAKKVQQADVIAFASVQHVKVQTLSENLEYQYVTCTLTNILKGKPVNNPAEVVLALKVKTEPPPDRLLSNQSYLVFLVGDRSLAPVSPSGSIVPAADANEKMLGDIRQVVKASSPIRYVSLNVRMTGGWMADTKIHSGGMRTGGHKSGGPAPFHHMDEKPLVNPALSNVIAQAEKVFLSPIPSQPTLATNDLVYITIETFDRETKTYERLREGKFEDSGLVELDKMLHEHRIGAW